MTHGNCPHRVWSVLARKGRGQVMARLRNAVLAVALATGSAGCATFCDECDDFPVPGGPGGYAMMPGSYTGPPLSRVSDAPPVGSPSQAPAASPSGPAATSAPGDETVPSPPAAPPAGPGPGGAAPLPDGGAAAAASPALIPVSSTPAFPASATPSAIENGMPVVE